MTHKEQVDAFIHEIVSVIDRFADEFDLMNVDIIGSLDLIKFEYCQNALENNQE